MAFSPPAVGCLVKKRLAKGGVTGTPGPPWLRPCTERSNLNHVITFDSHLNTTLIPTGANCGMSQSEFLGITYVYDNKVF